MSLRDRARGGAQVRAIQRDRPVPRFALVGEPLSEALRSQAWGFFMHGRRSVSGKRGPPPSAQEDVRALHGSITTTPQSSKSAVFRVATMASLTRAMAQIWQSNGLMGRPAARRSAAMAA